MEQGLMVLLKLLAISSIAFFVTACFHTILGYAKNSREFAPVARYTLIVSSVEACLFAFGLIIYIFIDKT